MIAPDGNWFDRLAERQSRRQLLKAALVGAALTLPFAASAAARSTDDCEIGCLYTARKRGFRAVDDCTAPQKACIAGVFDKFAWMPILNGGAFALAKEVCKQRYGARTAACRDRAILQQKAESYDCMQPDCSGFDPTGPDGPCEEWVKLGLQCCLDPSSSVGYCPAGAGSCCHPSGKGCASGVTLCGFGP